MLANGGQAGWFSPRRPGVGQADLERRAAVKFFIGRFCLAMGQEYPREKASHQRFWYKSSKSARLHAQLLKMDIL